MYFLLLYLVKGTKTIKQKLISPYFFKFSSRYWKNNLKMLIRCFHIPCSFPELFWFSVSDHPFYLIKCLEPSTLGWISFKSKCVVKVFWKCRWSLNRLAYLCFWNFAFDVDEATAFRSWRTILRRVLYRKCHLPAIMISNKIIGTVKSIRWSIETRKLSALTLSQCQGNCNYNFITKLSIFLLKLYFSIVLILRKILIFVFPLHLFMLMFSITLNYHMHFSGRFLQLIAFSARFAPLFPICGFGIKFHFDACWFIQ